MWLIYLAHLHHSNKATKISSEQLAPSHLITYSSKYYGSRNLIYSLISFGVSAYQDQTDLIMTHHLCPINFHKNTSLIFNALYLVRRGSNDWKLEKDGLSAQIYVHISLVFIYNFGYKYT